MLYSLPDVGDATPDLDSLTVTLDGKPLEATATLASDADRTASAGPPSSRSTSATA